MEIQRASIPSARRGHRLSAEHGRASDEGRLTAHQASACGGDVPLRAVPP